MQGSPKAGEQQGRLTRKLSPLVWLLLTLAAITLITLLSPAEQVLGVNARIVYLHGAWVWAALAGFTAAAVVGLFAWILHRPGLHSWSRALGRTGLFFWITYLPISMWAMQMNWNGLYLAEPRFRLAVIFSISGLLLQIGLALLENLAWASAANILFAIALFTALLNTPNVMHPTSPMLQSDPSRIQFYFMLLFGLALLAEWQVARLWFQLEPAIRSE
jgi:hypothetical protein